MMMMMVSSLAIGQIKVTAPNGNTKIGNTAVTPAGKLHVEGGNAIFEGGDVGIGLTSPERTLHMRGENATLRIDRDRNSPGFILARYSAGFNSIVNSYSFTAPAVGGQNYFQISDLNGAVTGGGSRRFVIDDDGGLIIGTSTTTPFKLRVEGDAIKTDGQVDWDIPSDKKLKKNIKPFKQGLDLILELNPVSYQYNGRAGTIDGKEAIGVLAQDLQKVIPHMVKEAVYTNPGDDGIEYLDGPPANFKNKSSEESYLSINTSSMQWILVNAIQDQQELIADKEEKILELETKINLIEDKLNQILEDGDFASQEITFEGLAKLEQNAPNPFNQKTIINYSIPKSAKTASINIFDLNGRLIKNVTLENGPGRIVLKSGELTANTYSYTLIIDGKIVDSKKMIITK